MVIEFGRGDVFFRAKPAKALVALSDEKIEWYASSLAKDIDCTFPHVIKILAYFGEMKLVSFEVKGRKKTITLTNKGRQIAAGFVKIVELLK